MESATGVPEIYWSLRKKYLFVYLLATFADWLQGPYLYRVYATYGYDKNEISLLYVAGFASGTISGMLIGHYADTFGRKRLCIMYSLTTTVTCLSTSITDSYVPLILARLFGGASSSILFSTFESWYVGQHLSRYKLNSELIGEVLTRATLYNGMLAILAGISSSLLVDSLKLGPLAPLLLAVPVSLLSGYSCAILWHENLPANREDTSLTTNLRQSLQILLFSKNRSRLLFLGASQSLFETVMYIFVFLWTPVLEPLRISHGLVFGGFMLCIITGSAINSLLAGRYRVRRELLLCLSVFLAAASIGGTTVGVYLQEIDAARPEGSYLCLASFLLFEVSVGIYYPAVGYLRGVLLPESHRASIANWFRLPSNLLICAGLLYIGIEVPDNFFIFAVCSLALVAAAIATVKLARIFLTDAKYRPVAKSSDAIDL